MARTARVCGHDGCPVIVIGDNYCPQHKPAPWASSTRAKQRPAGWARIRARVLRRDAYVCQYCGDAATEVDHVIAVSRGGSSSTTNLVASCQECNARKNVKERRRSSPSWGGRTT